MWWWGLDKVPLSISDQKTYAHVPSVIQWKGEINCSYPEVQLQLVNSEKKGKFTTDKIIPFFFAARWRKGEPCGGEAWAGERRIIELLQTCADCQL